LVEYKKREQERKWELDKERESERGREMSGER
jgi:hypothetical protein